MSLVTEHPASPSSMAIEHFQRRLSVETDCADVAASLRSEKQDFVLLHVIGAPQDYERHHVPGAIHLPHRQITAARMSEWAQDTIFVAYCAGPHCNGADQAALKLARLGRPVKVMIGGMTGWEDEGFPFASGKEPGALR